MKQHLELERLLALVADVQHGLQTVLAKSDGVDETEVVRPGLPVLFGEIGRAEAEVELDGVVAALRESAGLGGRRAQVLPGGVAGETVLREGTGGVFFGRRTKGLCIVSAGYE